MSYGISFVHYVCPECDSYMYSKKEDEFNGGEVDQSVESASHDCGHCNWFSIPLPDVRRIQSLKNKRRRKEKNAKEEV